MVVARGFTEKGLTKIAECGKIMAVIENYKYDPQTNRRIEQDEFKSFGRGKTNFKAMDLTNVAMDESFCDGIMKRR